MHSFEKDDLAVLTGGSWLYSECETVIRGFCFDARKLQAGECFIALGGGARDGHDFVEQAMQAGASAAIVERALPLALPQLLVDDSLLAIGRIAAGVRERFGGPVIGVTGSCGKTSIKEMLRILLGGKAAHATAGNWNNRIGVPMTLFDLNREKHAYAVIEAGINQPDEMKSLGEMICGDMTIVTNIGPAHLELLGSLEAIALEKSQLARRAKPNSPLILPASVLAFSAFAELAGQAIVVADAGETVPVESGRVVRYRIEAVDRESHFIFLGDADTPPFRVASPSRGIAKNAVLAIVAASELGLPLGDIRHRIELWRPESTRGRIVQNGAQTFYVDCYNANPASMKDALEAFDLSNPAGLPRCYVLGAMNELGANGPAFHAEIGRSLSVRASDRVFFVGPDCLTGAYAKGAAEGGVDTSKIVQSTSVENIQSMIAHFEGAIFLKGSRSYALEKLIPINS